MQNNWSQKDIERLRIMIRCGWLAREIAPVLGRTYNAVLQQAWVRGFEWPRRETRAPWTDQRRENHRAAMASWALARAAK